MSYVAVIGAGSWGTTLASLLSKKGYDVSLWVYEKDLAEEIERTRLNKVYLPDIRLPENIMVSHRIDEVVNKARYILNVVPAQYTRAVFKEISPYLSNGSAIISASKGIERGTLMTISSVLKELTGHEVAALSGPSFAKEVIKNLPAAVTLATENRNTGFLLQELFNTNTFRVYTHNDILGVEIGGALKNVIAIAAGISDSLGLGNNARASLITRGLAEITRLGVAMGAEEKTFAGLSGLGDLVLTCTSVLSRNYSLGIKLGQGMKLKDILEQTVSVVEGVETAESAFELSNKYNVEMPIIEQVYRIINEGKDPVLAVSDLMSRSMKPEFY
jgi:glycerol-3-phosphate dehydrogenase (NAD(P)+)